MGSGHTRANTAVFAADGPDVLMVDALQCHLRRRRPRRRHDRRAEDPSWLPGKFHCVPCYVATLIGFGLTLQPKGHDHEPLGIGEGMHQMTVADGSDTAAASEVCNKCTPLPFRRARRWPVAAEPVAPKIVAAKPADDEGEEEEGQGAADTATDVDTNCTLLPLRPSAFDVDYPGRGRAHRGRTRRR